MQISASTFSDPAMRAQLQDYYDNKKAQLYEAIKAREGTSQPEQVSFRGADGKVQSATPIAMSAEKMIGALVSFDKWLEFQAKSFENPVMGPEGLKRAQDQLASLEANSPDSPSNVRSTFSDGDTLLAYVNADGTTMLSSAAQVTLQPVLDRANGLGLSGQSRIDYLNQQFSAALADDYPDLKTTRYDAATNPSKREFAHMWYPNHDVDQHYRDAMAEAQDHFDGIAALNRQWQAKMTEIGNFLLGLQEA